MDQFSEFFHSYVLGKPSHPDLIPPIEGTPSNRTFTYFQLVVTLPFLSYIMFCVTPFLCSLFCAMVCDLCPDTLERLDMFSSHRCFNICPVNITGMSVQ